MCSIHILTSAIADQPAASLTKRSCSSNCSHCAISHRSDKCRRTCNTRRVVAAAVAFTESNFCWDNALGHRGQHHYIVAKQQQQQQQQQADVHLSLCVCFSSSSSPLCAVDSSSTIAAVAVAEVVCARSSSV
jgi:hypothetical protein